jgi:adenylyltransferase/sulfurtransferase
LNDPPPEDALAGGFYVFGPKEGVGVSVPEIQAEELKQRLDRGESVFLLDVRDEYEYEISNIGGHLIPLPELPRRYKELNTRQEIVAVCKMGPRGVKAVEFLQRHGFERVVNLSGGIHAWSDRVDKKVRKY